MGPANYIGFREKVVLERKKHYEKLLLAGGTPEETSEIVSMIIKCNKILFDLSMEKYSKDDSNNNS